MGRFLKDTDYEVQVRDEVLDLLLDKMDEEAAQIKLLWAEKVAISQMKKRLGKRYDTDILFAPAPETGEDPRDPYIAMCVIDLAVYHLWTGQAPGRIPETRSARYNDVLVWMRDEATGTDPGGGADMPVKAVDSYPNDIRIISRPPNNHKY